MADMFDAALRLWPLAAALLAGVALERYLPWRRRAPRTALYWLQIWVVYVLGAVAARLVAPVSALAAAGLAAHWNVGALHWVSAPLWLAVVVGVLAFDLTDYVRHRVLHGYDLLWRAHRLHHLDEHIDVTTALRFHPFEAMLTAAMLSAMSLIVGAPWQAVVAHAVLVLVVDVWGHANLRNPRWVRRLAVLMITPEAHRLHHGAETGQMNGNFGVIFSLWDRLFGTFRGAEDLGDRLVFGVAGTPQPRCETLASMLGDPLQKTAGDQSVVE